MPVRSEPVELLVESHRKFLAFVQRRLDNPADAEEILQAAFVKGLEKQDTIRDSESAVAWFYRLLRNAVTDFYRHRAAGDRAVAAAGNDFESVQPPPGIGQAVCQCLHALLPALNHDYAQLILRIDLGNATIAEIAAETGMTANNARVKLHRARRALRKQVVRACGTCAEHGCLDCTCSRD